MTSLAERQNDFASALLDPGQAIPGRLLVPRGAVVEERFGIYRNNVAVGLIEALRSTFPVVSRLVGEEFFSAMALVHASGSPPSSPVLLAYGADFPAFVEAFEPARALPYLADVARLEWLWLQSYHSADAAPLTIEDLHRIPVEQWPDLRLQLHPAVRLARFGRSVLGIWRAHQDDDEPGSIELDDGPEQIVITRPALRVQMAAVSPAVLSLLERIEIGGTLAEAVAAALDVEQDLDVPEAMRFLFDAGTLAGLGMGKCKVDIIDD